jgi:hypothetical protein
MFTRHEYRIRARDKWAARGATRSTFCCAGATTGSVTSARVNASIADPNRPLAQIVMARFFPLLPLIVSG